MRYALCALILLLSAAAFWYLFPRLISQVHYLSACNHFRQGSYALAATGLKKASRGQPGDYRIKKELGRVYHKLAELRPETDQKLFLTLKAKNRYLMAARLNPFDAEIAYGLAKTEARLEQLYHYLHPENRGNVYHALPYFEKAIRLRPNGLLYNYALLRYLYRHDKTDELLRVVRNLTGMYPPAYGYLKREPFWSPQVKEAAQQGLMIDD